MAQQQTLHQQLNEFATNHSDSTALFDATAELLANYLYKPIPYAESAVNQGIEMAKILQPLNCDSNTLIAAILYPSFYYHKIPLIQIEEKTNSTVSKLILGAERMEALHGFHRGMSKSRQEKQADNLRRMLLAIVEDIRIVLIKLAENLAILYYLRIAPSVQQQHIAKQTMNIYAPLANRLGIGQLKWQLEDLAFRYLHPQDYQDIKKALNMRRSDRENFINDMINQLTGFITKIGLKNTEVTGRAKHIYSIFRKMRRKQLSFSELYDTSAVRVLVPTITDCYALLGEIHSHWEHIEHEFDDYIAKPKANGYRSIHTCIIGPNQNNIEIQIRTHQMHQESELGVAAHWKYKEGSQVKSNYEDKINLLREVIDWQKDVSLSNQQQTLFSEFFADRIYIFTPKGDIIELPAKATALDFAYHIHTEVGNRTKGAKVNDKLVTLNHPLKTGDQVSIITAKDGTPSLDWLNPNQGYLKTRHAITKVKQWFKRKEYEAHLAAGQDIWDKATRRTTLAKKDLSKCLKHFNMRRSEDLLVALGANHLSVANIIQALNTKPQQETKSEYINHATPISSDNSIKIKGVDNLLTQIARCCKPIPGDSIIGYITKGRGITVHQEHCQNIKNAIKYRPERVTEINWNSDKKQIYQVDLSIQADDRRHLVRDVTAVISNHDIPIIGLNTHIARSINTAFIKLTLEIKTLEPLQKLINALRQVDSVTKVERL